MMVPDGLRASSEQGSSLRQLLRETMTLKEKGPLDAGLGYGGEGGIRTPVPVTRQDAFEAPPLRPLRYLSLFGARGRRPAPRLGSLHYARTSLLAPFRSRFGVSGAPLRTPASRRGIPLPAPGPSPRDDD